MIANEISWYLIITTKIINNRLTIIIAVLNTGGATTQKFGDSGCNNKD